MNEMKSLTLNNTKYDGFVDPVARALASASAVIKSASGETIAVSDSSHGKPYSLKIYGKTVQDGVPTPDAPVDMVSVGDSGSITVNVTGDNESQSMTIATPNGLPGIPVTAGGNYTDANGQQWICDDVDLARGVYVQRIKELEFNGSENWSLYTAQNIYYGLGILDVLDDSYVRTPGRCNQFAVRTTASMEENAAWLGVNNAVVFLLTREWYDKGVSAWKEHLSTNPLHIIYKIATPIEKPLSAEEIAAYAALCTYRDHTTVTNDASAHMELEYVMDAKKYIDSLLSASVVRLSYVTIKASNWLTEAESLHSQVVTMDGITPYSKVDLLPSAEQLAIFHNKDVAFVTENEDGVVTVFAIGDKPTQDYTMQAQITEVTV